jgi:hypothetical protein
MVADAIVVSNWAQLDSSKLPAGSHCGQWQSEHSTATVAVCSVHESLSTPDSEGAGRCQHLAPPPSGLLPGPATTPRAGVSVTMSADVN